MAHNPQEAAPLPPDDPLPVVSTPPCRRQPVRGQGCWIYCDRQRPTIWPEHQHADQVQLLLTFDRTECLARWRTDRAFRSGEKLIPLRHVWILPANTRHTVEWRREADLVKLHIETDWVSRLVGETIREVSIEPLAFYVAGEPIIGELCGLLRRHGRTGGPINEAAVAGLGAALAGQIMVAHFRDGGNRHPKRWILPRPLLDDVCTFIDTHLEEKLSLQVLARIAGLSPSYFGQMFRAALGLSPINYVIDRRVLRAREMLGRGGVTVAEVAHAVGFSDQHQMNRHFRRLLHTPPSAYRPGNPAEKYAR